LVGALAFSLQLYFDFSGYTDMAIGSARLFGIQLPLNFNSPYKASKITQLWNAWHMSLTRFFRDYFYFPLSHWLRRFAFLRTPLGQQFATYGNTLVIMLAIGLWHGASWNYVLWGGLNGLYLIIYQLWRQLRRRLGQDLTRQSGWGKICGWLLTFTAWTVALVLPNTANLTQTWTV
jgi:D-alanyl-lipoteichoic acid acyltransferase DltB (MBOAT superfamily)